MSVVGMKRRHVLGILALGAAMLMIGLLVKRGNQRVSIKYYCKDFHKIIWPRRLGAPELGTVCDIQLRT